MTLNTALAGLAAIFSGVLALRAFGNRAPVCYSAIQPGGEHALFVFNPNRKHSVVIAYVINRSGNDDLSIIRTDPHGGWPHSEKLAGPQYYLGLPIEPSQKAMVPISVKDPPTAKPMQVTVERNHFNYFASVPKFNLLVSPTDYRNWVLRALFWLIDSLGFIWRGLAGGYVMEREHPPSQPENRL
jgi:hypothetical protein